MPLLVVVASLLLLLLLLSSETSAGGNDSVCGCSDCVDGDVGDGEPDGDEGGQGVKYVKANSISWSQLLLLALALALALTAPTTESLPEWADADTFDWEFDWACNSLMMHFNMALA